MGKGNNPMHCLTKQKAQKKRALLLARVLPSQARRNLFVKLGNQCWMTALAFTSKVLLQRQRAGRNSTNGNAIKAFVLTPIFE